MSRGQIGGGLLLCGLVSICLVIRCRASSRLCSSSLFGGGLVVSILQLCGGLFSNDGLVDSGLLLWGGLVSNRLVSSRILLCGGLLFSSLLF